jgi:flagellar FliJ protein
MAAFKLQALLDHRRRKEERLQMELAQLEGELRHEQGLLLSYHRAREESLEERRQAHRVDFCAAEADLYFHFLRGIDDAIGKQRKAVESAEEQVRSKRADVWKAAQERKVIEKMKERQLKEIKEKVRKAENRVLDEVGIFNFLRREDALSLGDR